MNKIRIIGDLGVGGERGAVLQVNGICCSQSATQYKDAIKILDAKRIILETVTVSMNLRIVKEKIQIANTLQARD